MRVRARAGLLFSESPQAPPRPRFQPARTPHKSSPAGQVWEGRVAGKRAVCRPDGLITWAPARVEGFRPAGSAVVVTLGQLSPARVAGARRWARAVATKRCLKRMEPAARGLIPPPARVHVHGAVRLLPRVLVDLDRLADGLYPEALDRRGLAAALEELAGRCPLDVRLVRPPNVDDLPAAVKSVASFVVAEALINAVRGARAEGDRQPTFCPATACRTRDGLEHANRQRRQVPTIAASSSSSRRPFRRGVGLDGSRCAGHVWYQIWCALLWSGGAWQ